MRIGTRSWRPTTPARPRCGGLAMCCGTRWPRPLRCWATGNKLAAATAGQRLRGESATMRVRLTVEYVGDPPDGAIVNGRLQALTRLPDETDTLVGETQGVATADFAAAPLGFRTPSLFLTAQQPTVSEDGSLSLLTPNAELADPYLAAAATVTPLLAEELGPEPTRSMLLLDHEGDAYSEGGSAGSQTGGRREPDAGGARAGAAAHACMVSHVEQRTAGVSPTTWLDEGLPELMGLLFTERTGGREAALAELRHASSLLALAEPDFSGAGPAAAKPLGTPLAATGADAARDDVYLRLKSASVLWQLREIVGADAFRNALLAYRRSLGAKPALALDAESFEHAPRTGRRQGRRGAALVLRRLGLSRPQPARPHHRAGNATCAARPSSARTPATSSRWRCATTATR